MADSGQDRTRRWRAHKRGDHRACDKSRCPYAGRVERDDVAGLRQAIEVEFAGDPARLAIARRHVEQAAEKGQPGVAAVVALDRMVEEKRAARLRGDDGPVTIDDEVRELAGEIVRWELARRLDRLEADVAEVGWPAALAALRTELASELGELDGRGTR